MSGVYEPSDPVTAAAHVRMAGDRREVVRLEGVHAVKHAIRFGADIEVLVTPDRVQLLDLVASLAPDLLAAVRGRAVELSREVWQDLVPRGLPSPALAIAMRHEVSVPQLLEQPGRILALERPRHLGNLGAAIRVAAASHAGGVLVVDGPDPWHPTAVRAAAGLQFALACTGASDLPETTRPVLALDPVGVPLGSGSLPADAVLLVGTERGGLSAELRARADARIAIPMRAGVSSLNLATAVAVALFHGTGPASAP